MHTAARIVLGIYLAAVVFAFVAWVMGDGALESVFAIIVAAPWGFLFFRVLDLIWTEPPVQVVVFVLLIGVWINAGLLYLWVHKTAPA